VAELEGDILNALTKGDLAKVAEKYRKLIHARVALSSSEARRL